MSKQTVIWAVQNHQERLLIFFLQLKRHIRNGHIESPETRYKEFGSNTSKRTYLRRLESLVSIGWAVKTKTGITLIGIDKLPVMDHKEHNKHYYLKNDKSLTYVYIRHLISVFSEKAQKCKGKLHSEKKTQMIVKKINGNYRQILHDIRRDVSISVKTLSGKLNRSRSTTLRYIKQARMQGILKTCERFLYNPSATTNYKVFDGKRFQRIANEIETTFDFKVKNIVFLKDLDSWERSVMFYCNDCF